MEHVLTAIIFFYAWCGFFLSKWGDCEGRTPSFVIASVAMAIGIAGLFHPPLLNVVYTVVAIGYIGIVILDILCASPNNPSSRPTRA